MYKFKDFRNELITYQKPFICTMLEVLSYNSSTKFAVCSLKDESNEIIVGFLYNKFAELLDDRQVRNRLPFKISIVSGNIKQKGKKLTFEIYQCIFEKDFLINSSSLASHSYCEMSSYLNNHIHVYTPFNPSQIFGTIFHDYLMYVFEDKELLNISIRDSKIKTRVKTAFQQAIYRNWKPLAASNVDAEQYFEYFMTHFGQKEIEFINYELKKLRDFGDEYSFQAEVMARSKNFGLQGRIDRILWNSSKNSFTLYETKTGRTTFSAENTAKFQLMAYSLIFREYYTKELEELILEYPRNELHDRLKLIEFDESQIIRLVNMRNQIWAISIGRRPYDGPFKRCSSKCFQKDACSFYCLKSFLTKNCLNCERCNYYPILFDPLEFKEFRRINVYFDWFYQFLEMEYLNNQDLLLELGLPAKERENLGNCFSDVIINNIEENTHEESIRNRAQSNKFRIVFIRSPKSKNSLPFINTRINNSDYVLITPQNYRPLTLQSIPGNIYEIQKDYVTLDVSSDFLPEIKGFIKSALFRIDIITSNSLVNTQKSALDAFLRIPYLMGNENLKHIRKILLNISLNQKFEKKPKTHQFPLNLPGYNKNQQKAIQSALNFDDILLIQGPPGTGKTTVIVEIVNQLVKKMDKIPNYIKRERTKASQHISEDDQIVFERENVVIDSPQKDQDIKDKVPEFQFEDLITTKKILLTAYTNRAIDNLVEMLKTKYPKIDVVRIGNENSISEEIKPYSLDIQSKKEYQYADGQLHEIISPKVANTLLNNSTVVATTCLSANSLLLQNIEFEYVIIDEAGQVVEPAALLPILKAKRIVLVGDDAQLPPISVKEQNSLINSEYFADKNYLQQHYGTILQYQKEKETISLNTRKEIFLEELNALGIKPEDTLSISLFQRLKRKLKATSHFVLLTEQYRMNECISKFVSQKFYENKLVAGVVNGKKIGSQTISEFYKNHSISIPTNLSNVKPFENLYLKVMRHDRPIIFLDSKNIQALDSKLDTRFDEMTSKFNEVEAKLTTDLIAKIIEDYNKTNSEQSEEKFISLLANIGVITPYRAQVRLLRSKLSEKYLDNTKLHSIISKNLIIDTVDKFQGKESEIIFINLVDSNPNQELSSLYSELRRWNVSITRAKTKLVFIGNSSMFVSKKPTKTRTLLDYMEHTKLSNDSNGKGKHLKNRKKINRFFTDLINYIRNKKGYVILEENVLKTLT